MSRAASPAVLFDLDRTLVDVQSFTDYRSALVEVRRRLDEWPDIEVPATSWDRSAIACMQVLVALTGDPRWQEISDLIETYEALAVPVSVSMPGLAAALEATASLPRAVVTLLPEASARAALDRHGVDIPLLVPRRSDLRPKPHSDQLLEACRLLRTEPAAAVMVGDSTWDEESAIAAGMGFVGLTNGARDSEFSAGTVLATGLVELLPVLGRYV
jgi:phosphoglycolate phosphatase